MTERRFLGRIMQQAQQSEQNNFPDADDVYTPPTAQPQVVKEVVEVQVEVATPAPPVADAQGNLWFGRIGVSECGLIWDDYLTEEEWWNFFPTADKMREVSRRLSKASNWALADYFMIGIDRFLKSPEELATATGYEVNTVKTYASISRQFDEIKRLNAPTFSHAIKVMKLNSEAQDYWFAIAKQHKLSSRQLEQAIVENRLPEPKQKRSRKKVGIPDVRDTLDAATKNITEGRREQLKALLRRYLHELEQGGDR